MDQGMWDWTSLSTVQGSMVQLDCGRFITHTPVDCSSQDSSQDVPGMRIPSRQELRWVWTFGGESQSDCWCITWCISSLISRNLLAVTMPKDRRSARHSVFCCYFVLTCTLSATSSVNLVRTPCLVDGVNQLRRAVQAEAKIIFVQMFAVSRTTFFL